MGISRAIATTAITGLLLLCPCALVTAQHDGNPKTSPHLLIQTEDGIPIVEHPVPLPDSVQKILRADETVKGCLNDTQFPPSHDLNDLFLAAQIHLRSSKVADLIVGPRDVRCFVSASGIGQFWIFRSTHNGYDLALQTYGGLVMLKTKSHGYHDVQSLAGTTVGSSLTTTTYHFDGKAYQESDQKTEKINQ